MLLQVRCIWSKTAMAGWLSLLNLIVKKPIVAAHLSHAVSIDVSILSSQ